MLENKESLDESKLSLDEKGQKKGLMKESEEKRVDKYWKITKSFLKDEIEEVLRREENNFMPMKDYYDILKKRLLKIFE